MFPRYAHEHHQKLCFLPLVQQPSAAACFWVSFSCVFNQINDSFAFCIWSDNFCIVGLHLSGQYSPSSVRNRGLVTPAAMFVYSSYYCGSDCGNIMQVGNLYVKYIKSHPGAVLCLFFPSLCKNTVVTLYGWFSGFFKQVHGPTMKRQPRWCYAFKSF